MKAEIHLKLVFSPVFRALVQCRERSLIMETGKATVRDLLQRVSQETNGKIDGLIFEKDAKVVSAGLMIQVNDRIYTGNMLNQRPVMLEDKAVVTLMYYVSGG